MTAATSLDTVLLAQLTAPGAPPEPLLEATRGMSERHRKALARWVAEEFNRRYLVWRPEDDTALVAAAFALLPTAPALARTVAMTRYQGPISVLVDVLSERSPRWLPELGEKLCTSGIERFPSFRLVRELVRRGVIDSPTAYWYARSAIKDIGRDDLQPPHTNEEALRSDPGLIDDVVWRWFADDMWTSDLEEAGWVEALVWAAEEGLVDRERLLRETERRMGSTGHHAVTLFAVSLHKRLAS